MPPRPEKALLFDIDGTLADTDALHLEAFNLVLGPRGHVFDHGRFTRELQGFSNASISERFLANELPSRQVAIMEEKEAAFRNLVSGQIKPTTGLMTLLALADQASIPMVAVTNAPRLNAEMLLKLGLYQAMADLGACTSVALAEATGIRERYVQSLLTLRFRPLGRALATA
jgi:beta-phosphoglucomutase-like phosphatase (HAD superfamily)